VVCKPLPIKPGHMNNPKIDLNKAQEGDIQAFQRLFAPFQDALKSYLYRMLASRADAEDLAHDTFLQAFEKVATFTEQSTLKTWVFRIATNLAYNFLKRKKRWTPGVLAQAKELVMQNPALAQRIEQVAHHSPHASYEIREHIDTCFTCISKHLPIEHQVALLLKDVYSFSVSEIMNIMDRSEGQVKYFLQKARKSMTDVFDYRCALVNKEGICHQCSELNGWFNPKQHQQEALMRVKLVREAKKQSKEDLFRLRTELVQAIDPLRTDGNELQAVLMECNRLAMGE